MKPKLKSNTEELLITISYIDFLINEQPDRMMALDRKYKDLFATNNLSLIDLCKMVMEAIFVFIEVPNYEFTKPLSRQEYFKKADDIILRLKESYLDIPNTKLSKIEKQDILTGLHKFFNKSNGGLLPLYNQYTSTWCDKVAISFIMRFLFVFGLANVFNQISLLVSKGKIFGAGDEKHDEKGKFGIKENGIELESLPNFFEKISPSQKKEFLEEMKLPSSTLEPSFKSSKAIGDFFSEFFIEESQPPKKTFEKNYIRLIYNELIEVLPQFTPHRICIITGYIAIGFGLINESEYKPATSTYRSLNEFLKIRVGGLIK